MPLYLSVTALLAAVCLWALWPGRVHNVVDYDRVVRCHECGSVYLVLDSKKQARCPLCPREVCE